jgi:hypothetical protein
MNSSKRSNTCQDKTGKLLRKKAINMKNTMNMDELKKVTGGTGRNDYPYLNNAVGPVGKTEAVETCDPPCMNCVGPVGFPPK